MLTRNMPNLQHGAKQDLAVAASEVHTDCALFRHMDALRLQARSQRQRVDNVREDPQSFDLSLTWWRASQDRAGLRAAIHDVLQRT